jgi:hypothetical protein
MSALTEEQKKMEPRPDGMRRKKKRFIPLFLKAAMKSNCMPDILAARSESIDDRLMLADDWKGSGNKLVQSKNDSYSEAAAFYAKAMGLFVYLPADDAEAEPVRDFGNSEDDQAKVKKLILSGLLNTALCMIKLKEFKHGIHACNHALEIDSQSVKGLFRRSECHLGLGADWATRHGSATVGGGAGFGDATMGCAVKDLEAALAIDPTNKAVKAALAKPGFAPYRQGNTAQPPPQKASKLKFKNPTEEQKKKRQEKMGKAFSKGGLYRDMPDAPEEERSESGLPIELAEKIEKTMLEDSYEENGLTFGKNGSPLI